MAARSTAAVARRLVLTCCLLGVGTSLAGCYVVPAGPGWCYYHPYRCR